MRIACLNPVLAGLLFATSASAADFSFTGNFTEDNDVQFITFVLAEDATISLSTWSYGGGTNAAGTEILPGGFDPYLSLFDVSGALVLQTDDNLGANADPLTGVAYDARLTTSLGAGTYFLALSQYSNFPVGTSYGEGFEFDGMPGALGGFCAVAYTCGDPTDTTTIRTSAWAIDVRGVTTASTDGIPPVPEPGTYAMIAAGLGLLALAHRRRRRAG